MRRHSGYRKNKNIVFSIFFLGIIGALFYAAYKADHEVYISDVQQPYLQSSNYNEIAINGEEKHNPIIEENADKTLWTIWDSLGLNTWQNYFCEFSGYSFYADLNDNELEPLSLGGSDSHPSSDDGTQQRVRNLLKYKESYPMDLIIIENINDVFYYDSNLGSIEDDPFMRTQKISFDLGMSRGEIINFLSDDSLFLNIIENIPEQQRENGLVVSFPYLLSRDGVAGSTVLFSGTALNDGDITLTWDNRNFSVHITKGMSPLEISQKFNEYSFGGGMYRLCK